MRRCPTCGNQYTDGSLRYCLADGTALVPADETTAKREALRIDIPSPDSVRQSAGQPATENKGISTGIKVLLGLGAVGALVAVVAIVAAVLLISYAGKGTSENTKTATPTPSASVTPTTDAEKGRLQKELANAQRKLDEQKSSDRTANTAPFPEPSRTGVATARVNSPNDGFLALRDKPDAEYGTRLAKIPHGAVVTLEDCQRQRVAVSGRSGRWCMVTYEGTTGWVFDAWLDR
ncbi:MAG TPA: SH3 domain-containing protein [Pyrinomonadaceae bacterium]|nr:SH3 domain-containing protein [Pyrinomonadaceae bacterium]